MDVTLRDESIKRLSRRVLRHRWQRIVAGLACVVVFCTTYALILPAITLTRQAYCGIEEHTHSDACYEQVLVCGQDESDGHTHTDACYASEQVLVCGLEETEGHVHDDGCYQTETYLTCGLEETEGHVHTDACYERQMTCGKNEHTHTLQCYSNPDADVETEADRAASLPTLTGVWSDDVVAVALSQAGYTESTRNFEVLSDGETTKGYTRYGAWYGDPYGDWTTMFASFCTYYAQVPMPIDANLGRYMQKLADEHLWHAASEADYEPKPGSLVFLDTEDPDDVDRVGVLIMVEDDRLTLLVGDYNNKVDKLELVPNDPMIEGYVQLPEQPSEQVAEVAEPEPEGKPETAPEEPNADDSKAEEPKADDPKPEDPKSEESADETQEPGSDKDKPADETQAPASDADKPEEAGVEKPTEPESGSEDLSGDTNTLTFSGSDYTVTVGYTEKAEIPEDATLAVSEVYAGGVAYNDYLHDAKAALGIEDKRAEARFFDIKIMDGESEVKPAKPVTVTIAYDELPQSADPTQAEAVHFVATGAEVMDAEATAEGDGAQITFDAPSFSVYGVVYTVDFEYTTEGGTYYYTLSGGGKMTLSQLVQALGLPNGTDYADVNAFLSDVQSVAFSDESLVSVSKNMFGKDWTLNSLKPFDTNEELTITMNNGVTYTIKVTDDQNAEGVWDLSDTNNTQYLHVSADSSVTEGEQERDAAFKLTFTYALEEDVVRAIDQYDKPFELKYDLTELINSSPIGSVRNNLNGVISIGSRRLGTYTVVDGVVTLRFTDPSYFDGRTSFTGYFNLTAETSESELGNDDEYTYSFPGTTDTIPIHYKKTVEEGNKSVQRSKNNDGSYTLHYTANVNVNTDLDSMQFNDVLGGLQTLDSSSVKINGKSASVTTTGNGFTFDVASALGTTGVAKGSYQVTYDTKVTEDQLKQMTADQTTETNRASWKVNGDKDVPGGSTEITVDKPREPIPVTKTVDKTSAQPGETITYTVTYGSDTTDLSGFHISDYITDVVQPQGKVTLSYNGETTQIDYSSQATDNSFGKGSVTLFDHTISEGTQGKGPVTATYTVKVIDAETAKAHGIYDSTDVINMAQEHRQNTTDTKKTTVEFEKEPHYEVNKTVSANTGEGKWAPGTELTYTLTVGDANTNMAGVNIKDLMTDLQVLQGDVMITLGNGQQMKLSDYVANSMKWTDDGQYSDNKVTLFDFNMPDNAGNGPVVITYTTKVISQDSATASGIYGEHSIQNTGHGGKDSDGTSGTGIFDSYPINKQVTINDEDVNGHTINAGDTVHYTLTLGKAGMNLANAVIEDWMTDIQKLVGNITITRSNGTSFTMPLASGQWAEDGNRWDYWDDGKYNKYGQVWLFRYRLPNDIGEGPITIEYDAQIISEAEAKENGITGTTSALNAFSSNGVTPTTEVKIEYPKDVQHNPQVRKEFDRWDVENSRVYWNIIVEKDEESAYPLENVTVREAWDRGRVSVNEPNQGWYGKNDFDGTYFDVTHAVVTTDDGTVLTPGVDYTIDKDTSMFTFPVLNERVHINLAFESPIKIIDGYKMNNQVRLNNGKTADAEQTYTNPTVEAMKNGKYDEGSRIVTWEVQINPSSKTFDISDANKYVLQFEDHIPAGLTLLNYNDNTETNPSVHVKFGWREYDAYLDTEEQDDGTTKISGSIHPKDCNYDPYNTDVSLSGTKVVVTYKTKLSDEEWDRITSSASGSETFENKVTITAGDNEKFDATDQVTVTSKGYLNKTDTTVEQGGVVFDPTTNQNSKNITYRIEINPNGYVLNSGEPLALTDYIDANMDLDTSSVVISNAHKGDDGALVPDATAPVGIAMSYNDDSRLLAIRNIPDQTPLLLTYTCIARAQGQDTFKNTATLIGGGSHSSSTNEKHTIQTSDAGVAVDGLFINIHKIDENNISQNLANAQFQLYECELQIGELTNPETYDATWWANLLDLVNKRARGETTDAENNYIDSNFKIVNYKPVQDVKTTGNSGFTQWEGLSEHKLYAWVEVASPDGYTGYDPKDYHYFVGYQHLDVNVEDPSKTKPLEPAEQERRKNAAWALDDACQYANGIRVASLSNLTTWTATNVETQYTSISASKTWENDSDNLFETRPTNGIKLQLVRINADGSRENVGTPVAINAGPDGSWPTYIWNKLPSKDTNGNVLKYTIVEERVQDYTTTYSDGGEGQTAGEITITNRLIPKSTNIYVKKVFDVPEGETKPDQIKVDLMVIKTDKDGVASEPEEMNMEGVLNEANGWSWAFEKLDTKQVIDGKPYTLTYTVVEETSELERAGFHYTVSYSDDGKGVIETTVDNPLTITNKPIMGSVKVTKAFSGIESSQYPSSFAIDATWTERGEQRTATLTTAGDQPENVTLTGSGTSEDPFEWTINNLPLHAEVTFTETGYDVNGYDVTVTGSATSAEKTVATAVADENPGTASFVNTYTPLTFEVTKIWKDANNQNVEWQKDIDLVLHQKPESGSETTYEYHVHKADDGTISAICATEGAPTATVTGNAADGYTIHFEGLTSHCTYTATEVKPGDDYQEPEYGHKDDSGIYYKNEGAAAGRAADKECITNRPVEFYELPSTGGRGTTPYVVAGQLIMAISLLALIVITRRHEFGRRP